MNAALAARIAVRALEDGRGLHSEEVRDALDTLQASQEPYHRWLFDELDKARLRNDAEIAEVAVGGSGTVAWAMFGLVATITLGAFIIWG